MVGKMGSREDSPEVSLKASGLCQMSYDSLIVVICLRLKWICGGMVGNLKYIFPISIICFSRVGANFKHIRVEGEFSASWFQSSTTISKEENYRGAHAGVQRYAVHTSR
ncbi:hypothetical protein BY996DRAFT_6623482 [Phakopsora pachyrhizi]|nr:hypothetical protein BY996DRAFT_6623482 [Phakopsora pachyrhizi]